MEYRAFREQLLQSDPELQRQYEAENERLERQIARAIVRLRRRKGWTQEELARAMGTTQSVIARLESGYHRPSLATLEKVARVLDAQLEVRLESISV
ncbi:XRE family transcriptional regulator [Candidatus Parcubacteria bacterium]|nr:MAG: XRE family transcriptional regulator [Candidatus Parcubacteria bacterium]